MYDSGKIPNNMDTSMVVSVVS
ncbi:hypothetical protein AYI68_g6941, partial [Smittium mucronatum]